MSTAISEVAGVSRSRLREMYTSMGDLGKVLLFETRITIPWMADMYSCSIRV